MLATKDYLPKEKKMRKIEKKIAEKEFKVMVFKVI